MCQVLQIKMNYSQRGKGSVYIHLPNRLRHRAFLLLVNWMTSRMSPWATGRSFPPGFFMMLLGFTIMVCSTLRGPSYWENTVTVTHLHQISVFICSLYYKHEVENNASPHCGVYVKFLRDPSCSCLSIRFSLWTNNPGRYNKHSK